MKRIGLWFGQALIFIGKTMAISLVLISLNVLLLYLVELTGLYATTPNALSKPYNSHFKNIYRILPFFIVYVGWVHFSTIFLFHWIERNSSMSKFWEYITGISIVLFLFICYAIVVEGDIEMLYQGLLVYPLLGIFMVLLHNMFWKHKAIE